MFYDEMRAVASDVFAEFKQGTIEYVTMQPAAGSTPDDPGDPVVTVIPLNATAKPVSQRYVDGTHITGSEVEIAMPNDGVTPQMTGFIRIDSVTHKIVRIMARPAAGTPVSFNLIVKR